MHHSTSGVSVLSAYKMDILTLQGYFESQDYFMKVFNKSIIMRNVTATIAAAAAAAESMS